MHSYIVPISAFLLLIGADPTKMNPRKATDVIMRALKQQYAPWLPNGSFVACSDPTRDEIKKSCAGMRAKFVGERVLFHYNGHGVPNPTDRGEIWFFNKGITQYVPLTVSDISTWLGFPAVYVFDCNRAGQVVDVLLRGIESHRKEKLGSSATNYRDAQVLVLGACGADESLPLSPDYPADLFTACLTTPVQAAVRWFCRNAPLGQYPPDTAEKLKGSNSNRKTMLGDLSWLLTTITDTIAWDILPKDLFQKLFRQDLLVASIFRNFILAERVFHSFKLRPVSYPPLPPSYNHPLWNAWDLAVELIISQLPKMNDDCAVEYQPTSFFSDQLTSFEIWLDYMSVTRQPTFDSPIALPIILQVLLSQEYRLRALQLLARFLDLGEKAVYYVC